MKSLLLRNRFAWPGSTGTLFTLALALTSSTSLFAQTAMPPSAQAGPDTQSTPAASCPIRVDEAYLTADPAALPAQASNSGHTLHVTLVDVSGKQIVSYVVHAKIDLRPEGALTNAPKTGNIVRRWHGTLEPDTPTKQQWSYPADRFTSGLRRVWFSKVTFADGSSWDKSAGDSCTFAATGRIVQTMESPMQP